MEKPGEMDPSACKQSCPSVKDLIELAGNNHQQLIRLQGGDNQNACCGGNANESTQSVITNTPPHMVQQTGGFDKRTKFRQDAELAEARKVRLTGGSKSKTLLDDAVEEPLPRKLRRPSEPKFPTREKPKPREKTVSMPQRDAKYHEELEKYLHHLPFFGKCHYKRSEIVKCVSRIKPLRGILRSGRYYIEKDWKNDFDPRMDPEQLLVLKKKDDRKRKKFRSHGPVNRIVDLFMEKVMDWNKSREWYGENTPNKAANIALLWLGPHLARKMLKELCMTKEPAKTFETMDTDATSDRDFFVINRLPVDVFFSDKEAFYSMLKDYILSPSLACKIRKPEPSSVQTGSKQTCEELESNSLVTRRICPHQNLSLSLKPCLVPNCPNFKKPVCEHIYAFIPETITINSYISMLHFVERFQCLEDLKGCIFITKPAYLCNGRGINFIVNKEQFEYFYHMLEGKASSRHGVVLQRYIECPRLFDQQKFTIRFFLLIIVLPKRRVLGFIHYGLAIFCCLPYRPIVREEFSPEEEALEGKEPNLSVPIASRTIGRVVDTEFNRYIHLSNYYEPKFRTQIKEDLRTGKAKLIEQDEDNVFYLQDVLPSACPNSTSIYIQMLFVAQCIMDYMQPIIQGYPGTFQTVSVDSVVDARNKLWVLEAGTKIFSGLLTVAPRQRYVMSAIIQESIGLTLECFYKSQKNLPLHWNYKTSTEDYDAFYFAQDFNFFYETDITRQGEYFSARWKLGPNKGLEQRYDEADRSRLLARERRAANERRKRDWTLKRLEHISKVKQKHSEES